MSGGHFDYIQHRLIDVVQEIDRLISNELSEEIDEYGQPVKQGFSGATIRKFQEAMEIIMRAEIAIQRIDWLVSGDDGEKSFHKRWKEEMQALAERDK